MLARPQIAEGDAVDLLKRRPLVFIQAIRVKEPIGAGLLPFVLGAKTQGQTSALSQTGFSIIRLKYLGTRRIGVGGGNVATQSAAGAGPKATMRVLVQSPDNGDR